MKDALRRSATVEGAGSVRPWLQDFTLGSPRYEAPEVRAQILAARDVGVRDWILWNPGSRYTEDALEPAGGHPDGFDPLVRIGGKLVPASLRFEVGDQDAQVTPLVPMTPMAPMTFLTPLTSAIPLTDGSQAAEGAN